MLNILQARLQCCLNWEVPDVQVGFGKGRGMRDQIANIHLDHRKSKKIPEETSTYASFTMLSLWLCGSQQTVKFLEMGIPDHLTCLLRNLYTGQETTVRTGHETRTGSKLGKEYDKAVYCHPAYLTYMQSTSYEMLDWMNHKLESRLPREIPVTSDMQMIPLYWQKVKRN